MSDQRHVHCSFCGTPIEDFDQAFTYEVGRKKTAKRLVVVEMTFPICVGCADREGSEKEMAKTVAAAMGLQSLG